MTDHSTSRSCAGLQFQLRSTTATKRSTLHICYEAVDYNYRYGSDTTTENPASIDDEALNNDYSYGSNTAAKIPATIHYRCDEAPYTTATARLHLVDHYINSEVVDMMDDHIHNVSFSAI